MPKPLRYVTLPDGRVLIEQVIPEIEVSEKFVRGRPDFVKRRGRHLEFTAANGRLRYEITDHTLGSRLIAGWREGKIGW